MEFIGGKKKYGAIAMGKFLWISQSVNWRVVKVSQLLNID